jgi:transposase
MFSPVTIAAGPGATAVVLATPGAIEIEFATGARMRLMGPVDASTVRVMVTALAKAKGR